MTDREEHPPETVHHARLLVLKPRAAIILLQDKDPHRTNLLLPSQPVALTQGYYLP